MTLISSDDELVAFLVPDWVTTHRGERREGGGGKREVDGGVVFPLITFTHRCGFTVAALPFHPTA